MRRSSESRACASALLAESCCTLPISLMKVLVSSTCFWSALVFPSNASTSAVALSAARRRSGSRSSSSFLVVQRRHHLGSQLFGEALEALRQLDLHRADVQVALRGAGTAGASEVAVEAVAVQRPRVAREIEELEPVVAGIAVRGRERDLE